MKEALNAGFTGEEMKGEGQFDSLTNMPTFEQHMADSDPRGSSENEEIDANEETDEFGRKLEGLIKAGDYDGIAKLLPKEDREDFLEIVNEAREERLGKLFDRRLEKDSAETQQEAEERRGFEDEQNALVDVDLKRSNDNEKLRAEADQRLKDLSELYGQGDYLLTSDRHFLEDNDEDAYRNANQRRANANRATRYESMKDLGDINNIGEKDITKRRTIDAINELIRKKKEHIQSVGDYKNSTIDYDSQIEQLYSVLDDISKLEERLSSGAA